MNKTNPFDTFNRDVVNSVKNISEQIDKEYESEAPDREKISKLMWQQLFKGMELNSGMSGRFNYKPY